MSHKIFISYKYADNSVMQFSNQYETTVRDYVDILQKELEKNNQINKGEKDGEDLSDFKEDTIASKLRDKIYDSSVTIVLISPNMKEYYKKEDDQWIPWEISYSLKEIEREGRRKTPNGLIALILPDRNRSYSYFIDEQNCANCHCHTIMTNTTFSIIKNNIFNAKELYRTNCPYKTVYSGNSSYIIPVKWCDFFNNMDFYIEKALDNQREIYNFNIVKTV